MIIARCSVNINLFCIFILPKYLNQYSKHIQGSLCRESLENVSPYDLYFCIPNQLNPVNTNGNNVVLTNIDIELNYRMKEFKGHLRYPF